MPRRRETSDINMKQKKRKTLESVKNVCTDFGSAIHDEEPSGDLKKLTFGSVSEEFRMLAVKGLVPAMFDIKKGNTKQRCDLFVNSLVNFAVQVHPIYWGLLFEDKGGSSKDTVDVDELYLNPEQVNKIEKREEGSPWIDAKYLNWYVIFNFMKKDLVNMQSRTVEPIKTVQSLQKFLRNASDDDADKSSFGRLMSAFLVKLFDAKNPRPKVSLRNSVLDQRFVLYYNNHKAHLGDSKWSRRLAVLEEQLGDFPGALNEMVDAEKLEDEVMTDNDEDDDCGQVNILPINRGSRNRMQPSQQHPVTSRDYLIKLMQQREGHQRELARYTKQVQELQATIDFEDNQIEQLEMDVVMEESKEAAISTISEAIPEGERVEILGKLPKFVIDLLHQKEKYFPDLDLDQFRMQTLKAIKQSHTAQRGTRMEAIVIDVSETSSGNLVQQTSEDDELNVLNEAAKSCHSDANDEIPDKGPISRSSTALMESATFYPGRQDEEALDEDGGSPSYNTGILEEEIDVLKEAAASSQISNPVFKNVPEASTQSDADDRANESNKGNNSLHEQLEIASDFVQTVFSSSDSESAQANVTNAGPNLGSKTPNTHKYSVGLPPFLRSSYVDHRPEYICETSKKQDRGAEIAPFMKGSPMDNDRKRKQLASMRVIQTPKKKKTASTVSTATSKEYENLSQALKDAQATSESSASGTSDSESDSPRGSPN